MTILNQDWMTGVENNRKKREIVGETLSTELQLSESASLKNI